MNAILEVHSITGDRNILFEFDNDISRSPGHLAYDSNNNLAFVTDSLLDILLTIDLASGEKVITSK